MSLLAGAFIVLAILIFMISYVVFHGRRAAAIGDSLVAGHHQGGTTCVLWLTALFVTLLEAAVQTGLPRLHRTLLYDVHLSMSILFVLSFLLAKFGLNGNRYPAWHRKLVYVCIGAFAAALMTGIALTIKVAAS